MKQLLLNKTYTVLLDDVVHEWLHWYKWSAHVTENAIYARRTVLRPTDGITRYIYMHRMIAGLPLKTFRISFINKNTLDCQKDNLRCVCDDGRTIQWDMACGASHFNGVVWDARYGLWRSHLDGMVIGYFVGEIEAAMEYNKKAVKFAPETVNKFSFL